MPSISVTYRYDNRLAIDMLSGNKAGFNRLYAKYAPLLMGYITKLVANKKEAEVLLQAVFLEIWNKRHTYNPDIEPLYIWMFRITKNVIFKEAGENQITPDYVDMNNISNEKDGETQEIVFELMYYNKYTLQEIAELLDTDEDKIKTMLRSAIKKYKALSK